MRTTKRGADLLVGDAIRFLGHYYVIDRFESHPGVPSSWDPNERHPARVACSDTWAMTVEDDVDYEVLDTSPDQKKLAFAQFMNDLLNDERNGHEDFKNRTGPGRPSDPGLPA